MMAEGDPGTGGAPAGDPPAAAPAAAPAKDPPAAEPTPPAKPAAPAPAKPATKPAGDTITRRDKDGNAVVPAGAPESYDLNLPDDSPLLTDGETAEARISSYRERGLTNDEAQFALEQADLEVRQHHAAQQAALQQQTEGWGKELAEHKEFGGEHFKENSELNKRFMDRFFSDDFRKMLNETGIGNHVAFNLGVNKAARAMAEDTLVQPGATSTAKAGDKSLEDKIYDGNAAGKAAPAQAGG